MKNLSKLNFTKIEKEIRKEISAELLLDEPLKKHSSFKIGGKCKFFLKIQDEKDIIKLIGISKRYSIPIYIIGKGTNILFDDNGFLGIIVENEIKGTKVNNEEIEIYSGNLLDEFIECAKENSLMGIEFLVGIPGTIGGAIHGNAGAFGRSIGDYLIRAQVINRNGKILHVSKEYFQFQYRKSSLREKGDFVLKTTFRLKRGNKSEIGKNIKEIANYRENKNPAPRYPNAGSFFKNIITPDGKKIPAGELLEKVGAKGIRVGDAEVWNNHANYIINKGRATSKDVLELAKILKEKVKKQFGYILEEEVIYFNG
ncbi:MAG: UDP-N-acetylmuramate dehydrogenase [Acidobacteriota bacterium]